MAAPSSRLGKASPYSEKSRLEVYDGGAAFVGLGDEVVEVLVLRCPQGFQTEVIDDEQRHAGKGLTGSR